jgi:hypothetical protein
LNFARAKWEYVKQKNMGVFGMRKFVSRLSVAVLGASSFTTLSSAPALASSWADSISVDVSPVTTVFGSIAGALATIWAVRKVIALLNKS